MHSSCLHRGFNLSSDYVCCTILKADVKSILQEFSEPYYVPVLWVNEWQYPNFKLTIIIYLKQKEKYESLQLCVNLYGIYNNYSGDKW